MSLSAEKKENKIKAEMQTQAEKESQEGKAGRMRESKGNSNAVHDGQSNNHDIKKVGCVSKPHQTSLGRSPSVYDRTGPCS